MLKPALKKDYGGGHLVRENVLVWNRSRPSF